MMLSLGRKWASYRLPHLALTISRSLKQTPKRSQQQVQRIQQSIEDRFNRVDALVKKTGKVTRKEIDEIFKDIQTLQKSSVPATSSQSLLLIRCCGSLLAEEPASVRNQITKDIFTTLSESVKLDISHYNALLQVYIDNEFAFKPLDILSEIQDKGIEPNRVTYQRLIHRFCQLGDIEGATKILEFMKSKDLPVNEAVFNSLILGNGKNGDLSAAYATLDIMKKSGLEPTSDTFTALACAYASSKDPKDIEKIPDLLSEAAKSEVPLSDSDYLIVIKTLAFNDPKNPLIEKLIEDIPKAVGYNQECMKIVSELIHQNQVEVALKLYATMKPSPIQIQQKTVGNALIRQLVRSGVDPEIVLNICEELKSQGMNDYGLNKATQNSLQCGDVDNARIYLKKFASVMPLRVHYFWPMLAKANNEMEMFRIVGEDMIYLTNADYSTLHETFLEYVWPKVNLENDLFMEKCKAVGYSLTLTLNSLVDYHLRNNNLSEALHWITNPKYVNTTRLQPRYLIQSLYESYMNQPDAQNATKILQEISKNLARNSPFTSGETFQKTDWTGKFLIQVFASKLFDREKFITPLLHSIKASGLKISSNVLQTIRRRFEINEEDAQLLEGLVSDSLTGGDHYDRDDISKPRHEMNIDELEDLLIELKSKGLNTRGVLRSLLLSYCRRSRFSSDIIVETAQKRVSELIELLGKEDFEFSNAMYSALVEFYINCGNLEEAVANRNKINSNEFKIDTYKVINLANLYVMNDKIDEAFQLIKHETTLLSNLEQIPTEEDREKLKPNYDRCINRFLTTIIEKTKDPKLVKEGFDLALNFSKSKVTGLLLGPLIRVHLVNEDHKSALEEFVNQAEKHRVLSSKTELMRVFLEKSDMTSLQTIIDQSNVIHGEMNTMVELASACIDVGKIKQAKKLLETPGLRVRQAKLDNICERYVVEGKITELEHFIQVTKNLFDIDRDSLYYSLVKAYAKADDAQKALNVWTSMQEENIQPSNKTLRLIAGILERHNISTPFTVPSLPPPPPQPTIEHFPSSRQETTRNNNFAENNEKGSFNQLNAVLKKGDIDGALEMKRNFESLGETIPLSQQCAIIDLLLSSDRVTEASQQTDALLQSGKYPSPRLLRYLITKLAATGDLKTLKTLQTRMPQSLVQTAWYTSVIANAYVKADKAEEFVDKMLIDLKPFPLGGLLGILAAKPDLEEKVVNIANKLANETDFHLPQNMVWLHYMLNERYDDAHRIYSSNPKFKDFLLFTSLLDRVRETCNVTLARKLINTVLDSNLTSKSIGIAYGALIDILVEQNQIEEAEQVVIDELVNNNKYRSDPKTGERMKIVDIENLNRASLYRLINAIRELKQREPRFSTPRKPITTRKETNATEDGNGSSSDEEAMGATQK